MVLTLINEESFNYEALRALSAASYGGSDINEVAYTALDIKPGDLESWAKAWSSRAERVLHQARAAKSPVSARDALFRAATYFRSAEFYLHTNWDDQRIPEYWTKNVEAFTEAISLLLPTPGIRKVLATPHGFEVPIYWFAAGGGGGGADDDDDDAQVVVKRPTLIMHIGFDSGAEETFHSHGRAALERGYNVVCFDGPGQGSIRRDQGIPFTHEWEKAVSPVIDFLETQSCVDKNKIALLGMSLGGVLAVRAAAYEHRLAATVCNDGVLDFSSLGLFQAVFDKGVDSEEEGEQQQEAAVAFMNRGTEAVIERWVVAHGLWSFKAQTWAEVYRKAKQMSVEGLGSQVRCPVFVGDADADLFFKGQPQLLAKELGNKATLHTFTAADGAELHCHEGAARYSNQVILDWLDEQLGNK